MADYKLINGRGPASAKNRGNGVSRHSRVGQGQSQKPTQGIPIHVDGNQDELSNADPDLTLAELELKLLAESHDVHTGPVSSRHFGDGGNASVASRMSEVERTRARPVKPHESQPFLTVDTGTTGLKRSVSVTTPKGRLTKKESVRSESSGSFSHVRTGCRTPSSNGPSPGGNCCSPYLSPTPSAGYLSARSQGQSGRSQGQSARSQGHRSFGKMYISPSAFTPRSNPRIKMPFKHNIRKPSESQGQEPAQELKEITALATYHVNRILALEMGSTTKKKHGHLRKGKLQPLYPVSVSGPSITQCRGILSETRSYSASASRTLQRRRHIVMQIKSGELDLHGNASRPLGSESVHRVSAASSVEDLAGEDRAEEFVDSEDFQAELARMEHDAVFSQQLEEKMTFSKEMSSVSRDDSAMGPAKTPMSLDQGLGDLQNPDFSTPHPPPDSRNGLRRHGEETMEVSEDKGPPGETTVGSAMVQNGASSEELKESDPQAAPAMNNANNNFKVEGSLSQVPPEARRPQSASVQYSDPIRSQSQDKVRPKTAASVKAVRFADHALHSDGTKLPLSKSASSAEKVKVGEKREGEKTKEKKGAGERCKPVDAHKNRRTEDDEDGDGNSGVGGSGGGGSVAGGGAAGSKPSAEAAPVGKGESPTAAPGSKNSTFRPSGGGEQTANNADRDGQRANCRMGATEGEKMFSKAGPVDVVQPSAPEQSASSTRSSPFDGGTATERGYSESLVMRGNTSVDHSQRSEATPHCQAEAASDFLSAASSERPASSTAGSLTAGSGMSLPAPVPPTVGEREGHEAALQVLPPPPVTRPAKESDREGGQIGRIPDGAGLLKLLLEVSAEVDRELQHADSLPTDTSTPHDRASESADSPAGVRSPGSINSSAVSGNPGCLPEHHISGSGPPDCPEQRPMSSSSKDLQPELTDSGAKPDGSLASSSSLTVPVPCDEERPQSEQPSLKVHADPVSKSAVPSVTLMMQQGKATNPRVGVFVCKHRNTPRKAGGTVPEPGREERDGADSSLDHCPETDSPRSETNLFHSDRSTDFYGNSLTELFIHLSQNVDAVSEKVDPTSGEPLYAAPGSKTSGSGGSPRVSGILKKKGTASGRKAQPVKPHKAGQQQMFTHHSSKPFVYSSNDHFSATVAAQLKFGDSPYVKELVLPPQAKLQARKPRHSRQEGRGTSRERSAPRGLDRHPSSGTAASWEKHPTRWQEDAVHETKVALRSKQQRRPSRVKFANFTMQTMDLNQNCDGDDEEDDGDCGSTFSAEEEGSRPTQDHSTDEGACDNARRDQGLHGECLFDDDSWQTGPDSDIAARFTALEAEFSAVRSEIRLRILDNEAEQLLDGMEESSTLPNTSDNDSVVDDDDGDAYNSDDNFVYEDDGTSEEGQTDREKEGQGKRSSSQTATGDEDDSYSTYYRALLLEYRRKCMKAGEGNLVISDKLAWPWAAPRAPPSAAAETSNLRPKSTSLNVRPHSAGSFRTMSERRNSQLAKKRRNSLLDSPDLCHPRPASQSDSGWESEGISEFEGRVLDRWNSLLSVGGESVFSGCSVRSGSSTERGQSPLEAKRAAAGGGVSAGESLMTKMGSRPTSGREDHPQFEVVASSVPKAPARKAVPPVEGPVAPFPPLCFAINARPPPGSLFFFAYSTYMNPDRLGSLLQRQIEKRYWAVLFGFDLAFNKKGSEETCGGLANIVFNPFASVEGCVFLLTPADLHQLDAFTGAPQHYACVVLPVWMSEVSGSADDLGPAKYCVPAVTYIAQDDWTMKEGCAPNEFVASQCLKSADLLTPNYCDHLRSLLPAAS